VTYGATVGPVTGRTAFVWSDSLAAYDFGPEHPLAPVRVELAVRLARDLGLLADLDVLDPPVADDDLLGLVHTPAYVDAVRRASTAPPGWTDLGHGLGPGDNPVFAGMHEASAHVAGATTMAVRSVVDGSHEHAVSLAGGLHHAMADHASGFCVYNDVAIGIAAALAAGVERIAYVDVDVHHGDGVQAAFWDDPRVLTISLHESGRTLFPGTGDPDDVGGPRAVGTAVNVALPAGTGDTGWLHAFRSVVPPLVEAFRPQLLVTQQGCDTHVEDPLAHLALSVDGQRETYAALHELAHTQADGRWVATGGGGYAVVDVVPRAWAHLVGIAAGHPVTPETTVPEGWRSYVLRRLGHVAPLRMTDGPAAPDASRPAAEALVEPAIWATRRAVFPHHGLEVH
jgi:acetoin utilization protein AcuC